MKVEICIDLQLITVHFDHGNSKQEHVPFVVVNTNHTPNRNPNSKPNTVSNTNANTETCPRDALKLGVCANLLGGLPCCSLIQGLADLEAAVCLCTAIKANVLGINLNVPLSLSLLVNVCGGEVPNGFVCS
uniref:Bifunctional inhibitor/plant lipid transfer protein/seed storage helical domain-containing protein n=1 Tax=Lactuca sativa TaxID=4236 RepID=A0A9R1V458_LACSA|nr:hypothetical protein LSAT_V11C600318620 [Lactuca sativa]